MTRTEIFEALCERHLNDRYDIWKNMGERDADWMFYKGGLEMLQAFGCDWQRDEQGEHRVKLLDADSAKKLIINPCICKDCGKPYDGYDTYEQNICEDCFEKHYGYCDTCGEVMAYHDEMLDFNVGITCKKCAAECQ